MSLLYGDNFIGQTTFPTSSTYNFARLFYGSTYLKNINNLVLPATTLATGCYISMFNGCTGLTTVPSNLLPATTMANNCYNTMFSGCTGLTSNHQHYYLLLQWLRLVIKICSLVVQV